MKDEDKSETQFTRRGEDRGGPGQRALGFPLQTTAPGAPRTPLSWRLLHCPQTPRSLCCETGMTSGHVTFLVDSNLERRWKRGDFSNLIQELTLARGTSWEVGAFALGP